MRKLTLLGAMMGGLWAAAPGPVAAQDMMSTCATEITEYCATVSSGRGRILACLISHDTQLSAACKTDVTATAQKGSRNPLVPSGARQMMASGGSASVPATCSGDVSSFCGGISPGHERTLACLYAHSGKVSRDCTTQLKTALD